MTPAFLDVPLKAMRRSHAIAVALMCLFSVSALAQDPVLLEDYNWVISCHAGTYGLVQYTICWPKEPHPTSITIFYFGSRTCGLQTSVWPVLAVFVAALVALGWFITYGIGSLARPAKKRPSPQRILTP